MTEENSTSSCEHSDKLIYRITLGVAVMLMGALFLAHQHGYRFEFLMIDNWWAIFILIPAVAMAARVIMRVRRLGRFDSEAAGTTIGAISTALVAALFLLGLNFGKWWPVFVILGGLAILISGFGKDNDK